MKSIAKVIRTEINRADPIGLISMGAPSNEYDPEINIIVKKILKTGSVDELEHLIIYKTFVEMFGLETVGQKYKYKKLALNIFSKLKSIPDVST